MVNNHNDKDKLYSKAHIFYKAGEYNKAQEYVSLAIEKDDKFMMAHLLFADIIISQFEPFISETGIIKVEFIEPMKEAIVHLKSAEGLISDEQSDFLIDVIEKQGMLNSWIGNNDKAKNDFARALQIMPQKLTQIAHQNGKVLISG